MRILSCLSKEVTGHFDSLFGQVYNCKIIDKS